MCENSGSFMLRRRVIVLAILLLLFSMPSYASEAKESEIVEQFGVGFNEVTIADSSDYLDDPRDLEFHPGRANELWIANRATDTITIVENTGLENQTSQNRADSHRNHFLEEVSAISFGAYHPEFDYQWGSAQESRNTYDGQANPNNFMGPALWPSSLSHFAIENQNTGNGLLGSHIDMLHESPYGVGIAHDYDNVYWYNDGYYGELVVTDDFTPLWAGCVLSMAFFLYIVCEILGARMAPQIMCNIPLRMIASPSHRSARASPSSSLSPSPSSQARQYPASTTMSIIVSPRTAHSPGDGDPLWRR